MPSFLTLIGTACVGAFVLSTGVSAGTYEVGVAGRVMMHRQIAKVVDRSEGAKIVERGNKKSTSACPTKTKTKSKSKPKTHKKSKTAVKTPKDLVQQVKLGTQAGAAPAATVTSAADPYLKSLSIPLNNKANPLFKSKKSGVMTYYGQGLGACGDMYDDSTYTAAVSQLLYDKWPGASSAQNSNPICGPFVTGRYFLTSGDVVVKGSSHATLGGDGLINCTPNEQCHIPLTATVYNAATGVKFIVKIVDRCVGCAEGDIDLAPAAFLKLTVPKLNTAGFQVQQYMAEASKNVQGRVPVTWWFN